jgi:hypothetical protein
MICQKKIDQSGVISFITVAFLAGILLLITTGFVKIMLSNHRQSLDGQLNLQAFYAAESGINDLLQILPLSDDSYYGSDDCNLLIDGPLAGKNILNIDPNISYSCLLVDSEVEQILSEPNTQSGKMYKLELDGSGGGAPELNTVVVSWGDSMQNLSNSDIAEGNFPPSIITKTDTTPGEIPILRVTFYYPGTDFSRSTLINNQKTFFLMPPKLADFNTGTFPTLFVSGGKKKGNVINNSYFSSISEIGDYSDGAKNFVSCFSDGDKDYKCKAKFDLSKFVTLSPNKSGTYIRVRPIYSDTKVMVEGFKGNAESSHEKFINVQYDIDVTGRANDIYKRIKVRKDMFPNYKFPEYVTKLGDTICKNYEMYPDINGNSQKISIPTTLLCN